MINPQTQDDIDILVVAVNQLKDIADQQQQQIQNLIISNRNLVTRINRLDKQQREQHQLMY